MTAPLPPARVDTLVAWLREHHGQFTEDALRERLLAAGHPPDDVMAAFARLHANGEPPAPVRWPVTAPPPSVGGPAHHAGDSLIGFFGAIGAVIGIPLLLTWAGGGNLAVAVGLLATLGAFVMWGVLRDSDRRGIATGIGAALVVAVVLPIVAVVALFGYCLVAGGTVI